MTEEPKYFRMSLDNSNVLLTVVIGLVLLFAMWHLGFAVPAEIRENNGPSWTHGMAIGLHLVAASLLVLVIGVILYAPRKCKVDHSGVTVCRLGPDVFMPLEAIVEVQSMNLSILWRCGCGGFLGSWGWFGSSELGRFRGYLTRRDSFVVIVRKSALPVVLTPDNPEEFVIAVRHALAPVPDEGKRCR